MVSLMDKDDYKTELRALQIGLVALQRRLIAENGRLLVLFEGRDGSGKDGVIKRIAEHQSPRETRVVALGKPSDRDRASWYFQRYVPHLPAEGEMVLFNRSWYNRAGVEPVMGYCTPEQHARFLGEVNGFESMLLRDGVVVLKYYLDITREEQAARLEDRRVNPLKAWKSSPVDAVALEKFDAYTAARDAMFAATSEPAPWRVVKADDKRRARLEIIRDMVHASGLVDAAEPADPAVLTRWPAPEGFLAR